MRTVTDILTEFLVRNNRTTTDAFVSDASLKAWLIQSNIRANAYKKWPFTEGKSSTTFTTTITDEMGITIMQYPEGWKADSIRILNIGGKRMQKIDFSNFLRNIENYTQSSNSNNSRIFSDYSRQIYVNTGADVSGTMTAYGQYQPVLDPTDETSLTLFSGFDEEGNEAIIDLMTGYLKNREHLTEEALTFEKNAFKKLDEVWERIGDEQYAYQTKDTSMFDYIDVVRGRGPNNNNQNRFRENQF